MYILVEGQNVGQNYALYLNTDNNSATGSQILGYQRSGADFLFSGNLLYQSTGPGWNWNLISSASIAASRNLDAIEARIPLSAIGMSPTQIDSLSGVGIAFQQWTSNWSAVDVQIPLPNLFATLWLKAPPPPPARPISRPAPTPTPTPGTTTVNYVGDNISVFPNPERGFYSGQSPCNFDVATLSNLRNTQNITLVLCDFHLNSFVNSDISLDALRQFNLSMAAVRTAGLKAIVRFAYSWEGNARSRDADKARILSHIAQLKPFLVSNGDVISSMQAGFIGIWGEWYDTDHFGRDGQVSPQQMQDRKTIVEALLNALPASRAVQVRTPLFKKQFYGSAPLLANEAFSQTNKARVGHHNDCFLANETDFGTYVNVDADKAYLATENLYLPQGGETCASSAWSHWQNADRDMRNLHYSYLNADYQGEVLRSWGSNIEIAKRNLGYRISLTQGSYSSSVGSDGKLIVSFGVRNDGYAAPYNARKVHLILRHTATNALHTFPLNADPRTWQGGTSSSEKQTVILEGVSAGNYALLLHLADPAPLLANRPEYAIRLANANLWEAASGYNSLNHTVSVAGPALAGSKVFFAPDSNMTQRDVSDYPFTGLGAKRQTAN